jgi:hypothetical protein
MVRLPGVLVSKMNAPTRWVSEVAAGAGLLVSVQRTITLYSMHTALLIAAASGLIAAA